MIVIDETEIMLKLFGDYFQRIPNCKHVVNVNVEYQKTVRMMRLKSKFREIDLINEIKVIINSPLQTITKHRDRTV